MHLPEHLTRVVITSFPKNRNAPVSSMNKTGVVKQRRTPLAGGFANRGGVQTAIHPTKPNEFLFLTQIVGYARIGLPNKNLYFDHFVGMPTLI